METYATAPPLVFNVAGSKPRIFSFALATAEKASLISNRAISFTERPALARARGIALAGAMGKSIGAHAASEKAVVFAPVVSSCALGDGKRGRGRTDDSSERSQSVLSDLLLRSENNSRSTIVEITSIRRSDRSILPEDRLQSPNFISLDFLVFLVLGNDGISLSSINDSDRSDLGGEMSGGPGGGGSSVGFDSVVVLLFSSDFVLLCRLFSTVIHPS